MARLRADPRADFVRQKHPPRQDPLVETSSPVWKPWFPDLQRQSSSFPEAREGQILPLGYPPSRRRSFPRLESVAMGARFRPHYSPLYLPLRASGKVLARASFPVPDCPNPQEGGPNTESTSPLLASPSQRAISQNDVMINERWCVRLEDYLLGRRCGCCSGPRPR